jgi:coenzyme F420 hydrogenase subunit beta
MKNNNVPTIITKNLRIDELYKLNDDEFNKQQESGVSKRLGN